MTTAEWLELDARLLAVALCEMGCPVAHADQLVAGRGSSALADALIAEWTPCGAIQ